MEIKNQIGVGLRSTHYPHIEKSLSSQKRLNVDWFEAVSENYMDTRGRPFEILSKVREHYPVALHGVSLSIASFHEPSQNYLKRLKSLVDVIDPFIVSDHLCWTGVNHKNMHDLLPFPLNSESFEIVSRNVETVQAYLKRPLLLENVSAYLLFKENTYTEAQFLSELSKKTGCKVLLDLNNIYVNASNFNQSAQKYIEELDAKNIGQIHLGGPSDTGKFLFDTHSCEPPQAVLDLLTTQAEKYDTIPVLIEWDMDVPSFAVMESQVERTKSAISKGLCNTL